MAGPDPRGTPTVTYVAADPGPGLLVRAIWFLLVGWWLSGVVIGAGYALCATIIGLPLGFMLFNAVPMVVTLRPRSRYAVAVHDGGAMWVAGSGPAQRPVLVRAIWFLCIGLWVGAAWLVVAWLLCVLIVTLPIGLLMMNRVGAVMTLLRY